MTPIEPQASDTTQPSSPEPDRYHTEPSPEVAGARILALALCAGLVAGAASWLAGEAIVDAYKTALNPKMQSTPDAGAIRKFHEARAASACLTFGTMGAILGLAMGLAGGIGRRSMAAGVQFAILGLLLGGGVAGSTAFAVLPIFFQKYDPQAGDLVLPLLMHVADWSVVGATGGLAFGLGLGGRRWHSGLAGGLVGAAAAAVIFEIVGAVAFATSKTDLPVSTAIATRAMAHLLVAVLAAGGAAVAATQASARPLRT